MSELDPILGRLDRLIAQSRLNAVALMLATDRLARLTSMDRVLSQLPPGQYLLGAGPSTVGIIPLSVEEIVLGRAATPIEEPTSTVIDYAVADTMYFGPQEVSRAHAKIMRIQESDGLQCSVVDLGSTCGTFVNGEQVDTDGPGRELGHGDILSLGPSQISTYVYYDHKESL